MQSRIIQYKHSLVSKCPVECNGNKYRIKILFLLESIARHTVGLGQAASKCKETKVGVLIIGVAMEKGYLIVSFVLKFINFTLESH